MSAAPTTNTLSRPELPSGGTGYSISSAVRDQLLEEIGPKHDLAPSVLLTKTYNRRVVRARQEVMWRLRSLRSADGRPKHSYPAIGNALGGLDHTTVIFGVRAHAARLGQ